MRVFVSEKACDVCGSSEKVRQIDFEQMGNAGNLKLCSLCRAELLSCLANAALDDISSNHKKTEIDIKKSHDDIPEITKKLMREAKKMDEIAFEKKYLSDSIDLLIFEYIRGYGEADMDSEGTAIVTLMTDGMASETEVEKHVKSLCECGIIYPVEGKNGWYGAKYQFADE